MNHLKILSATTYEYLVTNKAKDKLPRVSFPCEASYIPCPERSIYKRAKIEIGTLMQLLKAIVSSIPAYRKLSVLSKLRGSGAGRSALVLGNGPSQGYLDPEKVSKFVVDRGDLFVVNYFNENAIFSNINPRYVVLSDYLTLTADNKDTRLLKKTSRLHQHLAQNVDIKIFAPMWFRDKDMFKNPVVFFNDIGACGWCKNINPLFPRGYVSMTLYRALAIACFIGYDSVYLLGMDNTYPFDMFVDQQNKLYNVERHAFGTKFLIEISHLYRNVGDLLSSTSELFYDLRLFESQPIINLDAYSLTDAFPKASPSQAEIFLYDAVMSEIYDS